MQDSQSVLKVLVIWRGNKYVVEMNSNSSLKELGTELQKLTDVKADTMRLIVPQNKGSKLMSPFSDDHSRLSVLEVSIIEGKPIRMMGVSEDEVDKVLQNEKEDLRIVGFDEEEKRLRQRMLDGPIAPLKLPQGQYIFCDFRTLQIPGVELNPPASEALKRMHMLAADPGIVAIMNKHRWHVGIMTEMAPVGYVGISPKCILGVNKNHGEEISLRLRTDDLKGFRKYERIKKTLLHELAHMLYSEHDANFYALDKQLNQEAASLDWTKSRGHSLSGVRYSDQYEDNLFAGDIRNASHKLGGNVSEQLVSARASSVAAAYRRLVNVSANSFEVSEVCEESDHMDLVEKENKIEPDPDDSLDGVMEVESILQPRKTMGEPDPDDSEAKGRISGYTNIARPNYGHSLANKTREDQGNMNAYREPDPDDTQANGIVQGEPDPDDTLVHAHCISSMKIDEPDPDAQELRRIQDPVTVVCSRLQKMIELLQAEVNPLEATTVLQTLFKIIRNVIEHPEEMKYKRLRKANPIIQRNVANYKAAMEILYLIGFNEDVVLDEIGKAETYLVLKRNDPGLLWLAKSSLETCIAY
ncbi:uncharacterized protein LOC116120231 isoform X2 [Pistacia vera]|uniref:uncharacterized protein LOC116120231 isoform X2 n=1 Tax=Pistacia vera TaxID=55513 RepID=UPI001262F583|nr:uncharacterized protein LOC116120231 isoform X2 [Pistacia vera]